MLTSLFCRAVHTLSGHFFCCNIPEWTVRVGQHWDTFDEAPWNLYNVIWRFGQWVAKHAEGPSSR